MQVPLTDGGLVDQECRHLEILSQRDASSGQILTEVLNDELLTEVGIEGTAVGDKGAGFSDITDQLHLGSLETISGFHPSDLVVLERVDQPVGLVHLLASLGGGVSQFLLLGHLTIVASTKLSLDSVDFVELCLGLSKLGLGLGERDRLYFKHVKLGLYNLGLLVVVAHGASPSTQTPKSGRCLFGDLRIE